VRRVSTIQQFYATNIQLLMRSGKNVLKMKETLWRNDLKIVKGILMLYVNFIAFGTIVSEKNRRQFFLSNFHMQFFRE
jgi:hypothetical protein